jgi:DNA-binding CsgD family transcriptional regulator
MPGQESNELSERELDILKLVATGASNKEIARKLFISSNTVKVHLRNIFTKIGAASRTEAAMYAVRKGLVDESLVVSPEGTIKFPPGLEANTDLSSSTKPNNPTVIRYLGLFGAVLVTVLIITIAFTSGKLFPSNAPVIPTPTQRVQWFELPGLPTPRHGLAVVSYDNRIYAIGGASAQGSTNVVESYEPQANSWTELAEKPTAVSDICAGVLGGLIYVPGGRLSSGAPTTTMEIYDPSNNTWSSGTALPKPLSAYGLAVFEGQIYLFGGWDGNQILNEALMFDPGENAWTEIQPMPTARSYPAVVVSGNKIFVIGGWDGHQAISVNEVYLPDSTNPGSQWIQATALPAGRYGMAAVNLANIIFIIGGIGPENNLTTIAMIPEESLWGQIDNPLVQDWAFLGATNIGTRFYVLGGETKDGLSTQMWSYQTLFTISLPIVR